MTTRATPNNIVPIGSSVLHLINSESSSSLPPEAANKSLSSEIPPSRPFTPCLLIAHPTNDGRNKENMFLVNGPSKSGKTSLAMDLACCRAYNHACQCLDPATCDCVSVLYFRLDRSNESNTATTQRQSDDFPLSCHQRQQSLENKSQETQLSSLYSNLEDRTKEEREGHDSSVLRRIKVLYVSSTQEILCELLAILGQQQHACQSIIIDDIDKIAASEPNPTSSIMQTLAVAVDTSRVFYRLSRISPVVVATTESKIMVSPWLEMIDVSVVSLHPQRTKDDETILQESDQGLVPINSFKANICQEWNGKNRVVSYSVAKRTGGNVGIYWMDT